MTQETPNPALAGQQPHKLIAARRVDPARSAANITLVMRAWHIDGRPGGADVGCGAGSPRELPAGSTGRALTRVRHRHPLFAVRPGQAAALAPAFAPMRAPGADGWGHGVRALVSSPRSARSPVDAARRSRWGSFSRACSLATDRHGIDAARCRSSWSGLMLPRARRSRGGRTRQPQVGRFSQQPLPLVLWLLLGPQRVASRAERRAAWP